MSGRERRISPRKPVAIPLQFQIAEGLKIGAAKAVVHGKPRSERGAGVAEILEGEGINLSERGIYFKTPVKLQVGEPIEIEFTLPRELTGRSPERVRCNARVVHVDVQLDAAGGIGVGAAVERFEPLRSIRDWDN